MDKNFWIAQHTPLPNSKLRLFCFHFAGGGASAFRDWLSLFPNSIEVCRVQLPGREGRIKHPLFTDIKALIPTLSQNLAEFFDKPFAFFGHSMGALVAFELAHYIQKNLKISPLCLFASGRKPPHAPQHRCIHPLPDDKFIDELRKFGGTPEAVLQNKELMQLFLPLIRADFTLCETYEYTERGPFHFPIYALGGTTDPEVSREDLHAWQQHTSQEFSVQEYPGGHFFIWSGNQPEVLHYVKDQLKKQGIL